MLLVIDPAYILENKEIQVEFLIKDLKDAGESTGQVSARIITMGSITVGKGLARWPTDYTSNFRTHLPIIHQCNDLVRPDSRKISLNRQAISVIVIVGSNSDRIRVNGQHDFEVAGPDESGIETTAA